MRFPLLKNFYHEGTKARKGEFGLEDYAFYGVFEMGYVEVDQEAQSLVCDLQIGHDLGLINRVHQLDRFYFDDDQVFDQEIESVIGVEGDAVLDDWDEDLIQDFEAS